MIHISRLLPLFLLSVRFAGAAPLVSFSETWEYREGSSAPQAAWQTLADESLDATWRSGPGWIGYGDGSGADTAGTTLSGMRNNYRTFLIRRTFAVPGDTPGTDEVVLETDFDDGFIAWIDGVPVDSQGVASELAFDDATTTVASHESSFGDSSPSPVRTTVLGTVEEKLGAGSHILSVMLVNQNLTSSDAVLKVNLSTRTPVPPLSLHWKLEDSPIVLTSTFDVPAGAELTIDPGVEVQCHSGSDAITCSGRITAIGTAEQPIRFVRAAVGSAWRRIVLSGTQESIFRWCDFDGANTSGTIHGAGTSGASPAVVLEKCRWLNTDVQMVDLTWTSCEIIDCEFDSIGAQELLHFSNMPATGHALIRGCRFGAPGVPPTSGYNDIIDFTGGNRPGPIARFIGNTFLACVDDCFDMDGTDAHIEGNIFLNVRKDASRSSSSNPITTGADGSALSELVICRNLFYDCEHVVMEKDNGTVLVQNNTIVKLVPNPFSNNTSPDGNEASGIIMFGEPWRSGFPFGDGAIFDGNIATEIDSAITTPWPVLPAASAEAGFFFPRRNNCIQRFLQTGPGNTGNLDTDPLLVSTSGVDAGNILTKFALQPGSPCLGSGPNGIDMGALVPAGASISGEPSDPTTSREALLSIAGPGIWAYQWRLNGGPWSAEISLVPAAVWNGAPFTGTMLDNTPPIELSGLADGEYTVEVRGKNSAGDWQESPSVSKSWTVLNVPVDGDGDGLPDAWETANGLDPQDPSDAARDLDGDGANNFDEYLAGTDPRDIASVLGVSLERLPDGGVRIRFDAVAGKSYRILASTLLETGPWTSVHTVPEQALPGVVEYTDAGAAEQSRRYYRIATP